MPAICIIVGTKKARAVRALIGLGGWQAPFLVIEAKGASDMTPKFYPERAQSELARAFQPAAGDEPTEFSGTDSPVLDTYKQSAQITDELEQAGVLDGIGAHPTRVNRYGKARSAALDIADYIDGSDYAQILGKQLQRLRQCGDYLVFRHYWTIDRVRLHGARLCCQHLLCPLCAIRRGAKALKAYLDRWDTIRADKPALRPFLVTLTVKDGPDLAERFEHLKSAQHELWKRRLRRRGSVLDGVAGAVWSYEIKRGNGSGLWHPHLHMIALAEVQPDQVELSREWHDITGDSFIVDVRPVCSDDPASGFIEVFKYAVKFSDQPHADTLHAFQTLRGKRLLASSGCFRGVVEPEGLLDDCEALEGLPFVTLFYRYLSGSYSLTT